MKLILNLRSRLLLFICLAVLFFAINLVLTMLVGHIIGDKPTLALRIGAIMQDVFMLIAPALITALVITRRPADFLGLTTKPQLSWVLVSMLVLALATPALNMVITWNEGMHLPESMKGLEDALREMEDKASDSIRLMFGGTTVWDLVLSILIIGVAAGFAEEIFFRGAFLRLLTTGGVNRHAAVWFVAVVFSAIHFEFFGFVPRVLLGAYFGYLLVWTRSLWIPVVCHAFNNTCYVLADWIARRQGLEESSIDTFGTGSEWPLAVVSVILTAAALWWLHKLCRGSKAVNQNSCDGK